MKSIKQVILIRRDLKMRRGKEIAQGSHASMYFLIDQIREQAADDADTNFVMQFSLEEIKWMSGGMAKVCLQVQSEDELKSVHASALSRGLKSFLVRDSGRTEFHGEATYTACAIGPDDAEKIDAVTGTLSLY